MAKQTFGFTVWPNYDRSTASTISYTPNIRVVGKVVWTRVFGVRLGRLRLELFWRR